MPPPQVIASSSCTQFKNVACSSSHLAVSRMVPCPATNQWICSLRALLHPWLYNTIQWLQSIHSSLLCAWQLKAACLGPIQYTLNGIQTHSWLPSSREKRVLGPWRFNVCFLEGEATCQSACLRSFEWQPAHIFQEDWILLQPCFHSDSENPSLDPHLHHLQGNLAECHHPTSFHSQYC